MPRLATPRRVAAVASVLLAASGAAILAGSSATAATSTQFTITAVSPHRVAAVTVNQILTITGTGFDEDEITAVNVDGCTAGSYIVESPTTLLFKTDNTCATTSSGVVTITDDNSDTVVSVPGATGGKQALVFVAAPSILTADATDRPVVSDNSAGRAYADQVTSASTTGGQTVRVYAGTTPFVNSATYPLSATFGGVAMTGVKLVAAAGSVPQYFTGVLGAHAASANPVLKITSNGVSKSFAYGAGGSSATAGTHDFTYAGNTITVSPAFGPANGGNTVTISGAGFTTSTTATVGGVSCPITSASRTATKLVCTVPAVAAGSAAGPVSVVTSTGSTTSINSSGSTYTYLG